MKNMENNLINLALVEVNESMLHLSNGKLLIESIIPTGKSDLYKSIPVEIVLLSFDDIINKGDEYLDVNGTHDFGIGNSIKIRVCSNPNGLDEGCYKIIRQSKLSPEYIEEFIEKYNNK